MNIRNNVSNFYYLLLSVSVSGLMGSSYIIYNLINKPVKIKEIGKQYLADEDCLIFNKEHNSKLSFIYYLSVSLINEKIFINKKDIIMIIGLLKEYSDYIFDLRNNKYVKDRRNLLKATQIDIVKYEELCNEYFDLYNFSFKIARKEILKKINLKRKRFNKSWDKFSADDLVYCYINYYSNIFDNFTFLNDNLKLKEQDTLNIFISYSNDIITEVQKLENLLSSDTSFTTDLYAKKLNFLKLKLNDEYFIKYGTDDKALKYLAITYYKLHLKYSYINAILEKLNGIELISIGFS